MKPPHRKGFFGEIVHHLEIAHYAAFLGANAPTSVKFRHASDGYVESRPFKIREITRREYPNPNLIRGVLTYDTNRPGVDSGDNVAEDEAVLELWVYPETLVYLASEYESANWCILGDLSSGAIYRKLQDTKTYLKENSKYYRAIRFDGAVPNGRVIAFDSMDKYDMVEIIKLPGE